ncbi:LysR substrate-binding domain-containing protein [Phyllobacterium sp. SB3]
MLPRARSIVDELTRMMSDVSDLTNLKRGHVNVGCLASIAYQYLPRVISQFQQRHPDIRLNVRDDNAAGLFRLLETREIDFAITSKTDSNVGIEFETLLTDNYHLLCRSDHPLAGRRSVEWSELGSHAYIGWAKGTANRFAVEVGLNEVGIELTPTFELSQLGTVLGMVDLALGVAAVPFLACPTSAKYAAPLLTNPQISREVGIATLTDNLPSPAAKRFITMVANQLRDTL